MPKVRGRVAGFRMGDDHRAKIANSQILRHLVEHATGKRELSATQVTAGIALLKKVLPDLQAIELSGDENNPVQHVHTVELIGRIAAKADDQSDG